MPAAQAYASARSPYTQRARVLGTLELSWAAAALLGVTALTQLVEGFDSWAAAFYAQLILGAVVLLLTLTLEGGPERGSESAGRQQGGSFLGALRVPGVPAALGLIFCQMMAVELVFVVYGAWLQQDFGASTEQLGLIFGLLGVAELGGALGATLLTDRIGKRRAVLAGSMAFGLLLLALPTSGGSWGLFLTLFLLFDLCFEFAIVSMFPLVSGLTRVGRGALLATMVAMIGLARIVGSLVGPGLFAAVGFWGNGLLAGGLTLAGVGMGVIWLREGDSE